MLPENKITLHRFPGVTNPFEKIRDDFSKDYPTLVFRLEKDVRLRLALLCWLATLRLRFLFWLTKWNGISAAVAVSAAVAAAVRLQSTAAPFFSFAQNIAPNGGPTHWLIEPHGKQASHRHKKIATFRFWFWELILRFRDAIALLKVVLRKALKVVLRKALKVVFSSVYALSGYNQL